MRISLTLLLCAFASGIAAQASPIVFLTPSGSATGGRSVSAEADFSLSNGVLTLVLKNSQSGMVDAGQLLTDIFFVLDGVDSANLTAVTGTQIHLDGKTGDVDPLNNNWILQTGVEPFENAFHLDMLNHQPNLGILGPSPNPNSSLKNGPHNPLYDQQAVFTIKSPEISENTNISGVVFSFGTTACSENSSNCIAAIPQTHPGPQTDPVPEPVALFSAGSGLLVVAGFARRFRRQRQPE